MDCLVLEYLSTKNSPAQKYLIFRAFPAGTPVINAQPESNLVKLSNKINVWLLLALLLAAVTHFRWLSFSTFQYGDWRFHFAEVGAAFMELSPWFTNFNLGEASITLWKLPFNIIYGAFGHAGFDSNISEKVLVLWPAIFLPPLASFLLVRQVVRSNPAALAGALVYSFNSYFFSINTQGHEFLTVSAAFAIVAIWLFVRAIDQKLISSYLSAGLFMCVSVIYDIRMAYIAVFASIFYWIYFVVLSQSRLNALKETAVGIGVLASTSVLLNCYWLPPQMSSRSILSNEILNRPLFGDQFMNIVRATALFHPFWNGAKPEWFVVQPIPWYFFILPVLACFGLLLNTRNKKVLFFGIIALIGILLGKQSGEPFTGLYSFLFANVPGFAGFREASKFYFLIAMAYAVLVGALVSQLDAKPPGIKYARLVKSAVWLMILSVSALNAKPLITGEIETMFVKWHVPDDYARLKQHVLADREYSRVLWIPTDTPWEVNNGVHPTIGAASMVFSDWDKLFSSQKNDINQDFRDRIHFLLDHPGFQRLLANSSVRYIVVPLRDTANDGDFYQSYGGSRDAFISKLNRLSGIHQLDIGMHDVTVYENPNYHSHIYLTTGAEAIGKFVPFSPVKFDAKRNSQYRIHLTNISSPVYLNFTDNYHPGWRIYLGPFAWWDAVRGKAITLPASSHIKSDAGLNAFYIDPSYIKRNYPKDAYKENVDGSIDIEMTLYFRPQAYLDLGLIISLSTLAGYLAYLLARRFRASRAGVS